MPYYGDGLPYYYGGSFANHSSLMTGTGRIHTPLSRYSPHLSTITESPLTNLRRYSPASVPARPKRVIDTADIDVSTPRILTHEGTRQRNRLRRDRPTIKIRSQALKDNPALREHNERHEKSVGELLVEKFLIKEKKADEEERRPRVYRQVSLEKEPEAQVMQSKITRRFTRRRSSADIQLDPEQLEREVAYAQVQAEVLDNLLAEEQAEIENEVRRGTLIRKGTVGGSRTVPPFFRGMEHDSGSQEEDEAAAVKTKKTPKKVKKKKKTTDKPSPPTDDESVQESRRSSTSSDVSVELRKKDGNVDLEDEANAKPRMYKIEASNSVGDFSTVWLNKPGNEERKMTVEQFRESIRITVPRKLTESAEKVAVKNLADEMETAVVLPARRPYVKDTSRNSVYFTVKAPQDVPRPDSEAKETAKPDSAETVANGFNDVVESPKPEDAKATSKREFVLPRKTRTEPPANANALLQKTSEEESPRRNERIDADLPESKERVNDVVRTVDSTVSTPRKNEKVQESKPAAKDRKGEVASGKKAGGVFDNAADRSRSIVPRNEERRSPSDTCEKSASAVAVPPRAEPMPKPSKINTDQNNAVEAPELSLREAAYLAEPAKSERDENVGAPLPGKTSGKIATLPKTSSSRVTGRPEHVEPRKSEKPEDRTRSKVTEIGGASSAAKETTLPKGPKSESPKIVEDAKKSRGEDAKSVELTKDTDLPKSTKIEGVENGGEQPKFSFKTTDSSIPAKVEAERGLDVAEDAKDSSKVMNSSKPLKTERDKIHDTDVGKQTTKDLPATRKIENDKVNGVEGKFPWKVKVQPKTVATTAKGNDAAESPDSAKDSTAPKPSSLVGTKNLNATPKVSGIPKVFNKSISVEPPKPLLKDPLAKAFKQSASVDESQKTKALPIDKKQDAIVTPKKRQQENSKASIESPDQNIDGTLSKSTSSESIDFWSEIKAPESPKVPRPKPPFNFDRPNLSDGRGSPLPPASESSTAIEPPDDKKKETDLKISLPPVIPESPKSKTEEQTPNSEVPPGPAASSETFPRKRKNLVLSIAQPKVPFNREDSAASTISASSLTSTPDTSVPASEVSTPIAEFPLPTINIVEAPTLARTDSRNQEDENEDPTTPTNEPAESGLGKISKWSNRNDLSNVDDAEKDVTPVPSANASVTSTPADSPKSSNKKKVVKKKKSSTTKKSPAKKSSPKAEKEPADSRKDSGRSLEPDTLKPPDRKSSPRNTPGQRPMDLIRMFYTTPSALLTATPRDLSKVRRAKIKRRKHQSRPASMNSDSTGSTTSTATTESTDGSGSTCTELDDDPEHKRMNSTRSNDSGFDGSPRISNCDMACHKKCEKLTGNLCGLNQKLVAEALQSLKRAPSQSSDNQRNSDSSDHFPSGRITPPATNLPRFKKYALVDFNFLKVLGKGSFGKVLLAELRGTECVYAVKCLKKDVVLEDDDVECTLIERKVLTLATRHPYLCHLFCTFQTESHLFFVMEYLNGGDLMFHIQKSGRFAESRARFYAAEIWSGLNFLHKKGIVYRDLKLDNVLLDFEGHIRIADFGMCKLQIFLDRTADTFCGTPDYMAPEIIKGLKYNQAVDWWSYGVLLYEMLTGQSPFSGCDEDELFWSICNERPFIPRYLSQEATDVLVCLLEKDSGKRLPGHEIALHPFFQSLPWDRLERRQLEAPFKPALDHTLDTKYFDTAFTAERPRLTPVPEQILTSMDQGVFRGFSYTNPNATD